MGIATRWSNVLRTGSVDAKFVVVNFGTLMFTMERGRDILEVGASFLWIGHFLTMAVKLGQNSGLLIWKKNGGLDLTSSPERLDVKKKSEQLSSTISFTLWTHGLVMWTAITFP